MKNNTHLTANLSMNNHRSLCFAIGSLKMSEEFTPSSPQPSSPPTTPGAPPRRGPSNGRHRNIGPGQPTVKLGLEDLAQTPAPAPAPHPSSLVPPTLLMELPASQAPHPPLVTAIEQDEADYHAWLDQLYAMFQAGQPHPEEANYYTWLAQLDVSRYLSDPLGSGY